MEKTKNSIIKNITENIDRFVGKVRPSSLKSWLFESCVKKDTFCRDYWQFTNLLGKILNWTALGAEKQKKIPMGALIQEGLLTEEEVEEYYRVKSELDRCRREDCEEIGEVEKKFNRLDDKIFQAFRTYVEEKLFYELEDKELWELEKICRKHGEDREGLEVSIACSLVEEVGGFCRSREHAEACATYLYEKGGKIL
jgi:hypothetical protein